MPAKADSSHALVSAAFRTSEEREFRVWLRSVERRAILPLKWAIFVTSFIFWRLSHANYWPPPTGVFALFVVYLMVNLGESYFFWVSRVGLSQVRNVCIVSYCIDVLFVTVLVFFDAQKYPAAPGPGTDFYIFYFLLILRGFALFRTARGNLMANAVVGAIFVVTLLWQDTSTFNSRNALIRIIFIWLVILMSWFIVEIINRQKAEIMRARENLIRSENMSVLGQLAAGVAHEINNPIGIISAYAELFLKNAPIDDTRREDFEAIHTEALRCKDIVAELLTYARPSAPTRKPVDLRVLNDEVLNFLFRHQPSELIKIEKDYAADLPNAPIDANQLKQALLNIYLNARQAMEKKGGVLRVILRRERPTGGVIQRVEDTGSGISEHEMKHIFDPFFTTRHGGTGLGLSITRRIIEDHGGTIRLESNPGQGTAVEITLPGNAAPVPLPPFEEGDSQFVPGF